MGKCVLLHFYRAACIALMQSNHDKAVCLSVCLSDAWFVTKRKRKKLVLTLLCHMKGRSS